jgi:VWFA-related protein
MKPETWPVALVLAILGAGVVASQQTAPQQPPPTFRSGTTVVEVDVIARDDKGRFVRDLRAGDIEVFEDGVPQQISAIYRVIGPNEPATSPAVDDATPLPAPSPQQVQRVLVFYFDHTHMAPGSVDRAKKAALDFLETNFRPGDVGGVLNGPVMVNSRLTSNREELETAVRSVKPSGNPGELTRELRQWPRFVDVFEAYRVSRNETGYGSGATTMLGVVTQRACRDQPDQCRGNTAMVEAQVQSKATQIVALARLTGKQTLDTVGALTNGLAKLPGRKTLIMLTEGFFAEDAWADLGAVVGRAARAAVRIYAVDTRGLNRGSASSDIFSSESPSQPELSAPSMSDTNSDAPNSLAVDTGGYVVRNENDFGRAFTEIDRDTSSYYIVGFRTTRPPDGKYHPITVRVKRSGVAVRARKGYLASPDSNPNPSQNASSSPSPSPSPGSTGGTPFLPKTSAGELASPKPTGAGGEGATPVLPKTGAGGEAALASPKPTGAGGEGGPVRARPVTEHVGTLEAAGSGGPAVPEAIVKVARAGWEAYQRGDLKTARETLRPLAGNSAAPAWAHYVLGWSEYASAHYPEATVQWERVRGVVPQFEAVYFDLADGYLQQKEFGKAIGILRDAQKRWPKDVEVYNAIGVTQAGRGALNDAIKTFEDAVAVGPSDATACYNLAKSLELRFVQMQRLRKISTQNVSEILTDRDRAVEFYRRTAQLGGPNTEAAKEGLRRLGAE